MNNSSNFIISTDFSSLGQNKEVSGSLTVPSGLAVTSNNVYSNSTDLTLAGTGHLRAKVTSNSYSGTASATRINVMRNWTMSGNTVEIELSLLISRTSATNVNVLVTAFNPYASTMTLQGGAVTFDFKIQELAMPF